MKRGQNDIIIVGAGLSGLMTAWRVLTLNPDLKVLVIERSETIAGNHTWSFNRSDISSHLHSFIAPFIAYEWPAYCVKFPKLQRKLDIPYCTGNSQTLTNCVASLIKGGRLEILTRTSVRHVTSYTITTEYGKTYHAKRVFDARGFRPDENVHLGYQKFVGRTLRTQVPHGLEMPIIMDATVDQLDGYRFVYCLPFNAHEILVEDTYYSDGADLSENVIHMRLDDYIHRQGWSDHTLVHTETGVLPITLAVGAYPENETRIGIQGGFYHAVTGYSFPNALKLADAIAQDPFGVDISALKDEHINGERFFRLLNRMLFRAAAPTERYKVLQRFYKLPQPLIRRFYSGHPSWFDKLRVLTGKPPVPISKALYNFSEKAFIRRETKSGTQIR